MIPIDAFSQIQSGKSLKSQGYRFDENIVASSNGLQMAQSPLYVKALPLQELDDVEAIKAEISTGNILIVRITPLAKKIIDEIN